MHQRAASPERKKPKKTARNVIIIVVAAVLLLCAAAAAFFLLGGDTFQKAPPAYMATGQVKALRVAAPEVYDEEGLAAYFADAVAFLEENGFNTLIFEAKSGFATWWRDKIFAPPAEIAAQDSFFSKLDPLALLCSALEGKEIQLWLEVTPYSTAGIPTEAKGEAVDAARSYAAAGAIPASDAAYQALLVESLARLPVKYPVAGIVFSGLGATAQPGEEAVAFGQMAEAVHTALADEGRLVPLALAYGQSAIYATNASARALQEAGVITYVLPDIAAGQGMAANIAAATQSGKGYIAVVPAEDRGLFAYTASQSPAMAGMLLGTWPEAAADTGRFALLAAATTPVEGAMPTGFSLPGILGISYPAQNATIRTAGLFIMGSSDPALPLTMDGAEVPRAEGGLFGIAVELSVGANSFTFTQGERTLSLNVTRRVPTGGGGGTLPSDSTREAEAGQVVRVNAVIASALKDPHNDASMNETLQQGAVFVAQGSVRTQRSGYNTWAYQMESGDYVLARNCEFLTGNDGAAAFTGLRAVQDDGGEYLMFEGSGTPAGYVAYGNEDGTLTLTFYNTTLQVPAGFASAYVTSAAVESLPGRVVLTLQTQGIWGYSLEYEDGATRLYLKKPPQRSADAARPLAGVRVMLDAGHGGNDIGSPGVLWDTGPHENAVNLALAQAISYRLRQMGATVIMTRTDDTRVELEERLALQIAEKPDFFISVHHNAMDPDKDLNGALGSEVYYYHPYNTPPSDVFANNLLDLVTEYTGRAYRKADWSYYYVTRTTVCPSVLFEFGFLMNPAEYEDIVSGESMAEIAFAVGEGILATLPA